MSGPIGLSVIVAASWSAEAVGRTVASIEADDGVEVIVASDPRRVAASASVSAARWVCGEPGDGVPRLRRLGADAARGRVIAFIEDACVVGPDWASAIRATFRDEHVLAATGPVLQALPASATDWAVYFAEYALFARPSHPIRLAGINFAVRRECLTRSPTIREAEVGARLSGSSRIIDGAGVSHLRAYRWPDAFRDRWRFGREFGRDRWVDRPGRLGRLGVLAALAIFGVQLIRLAGCVMRQPSLLLPLLGSLPPTLALLMAWSMGEALGWADARDGRSPRHGRAARTPA